MMEEITRTRSALKNRSPNTVAGSPESWIDMMLMGIATGYDFAIYDVLEFLIANDRPQMAEKVEALFLGPMAERAVTITESQP